VTAINFCRKQETEASAVLASDLATQPDGVPDDVNGNATTLPQTEEPITAATTAATTADTLMPAASDAPQTTLVEPPMSATQEHIPAETQPAPSDAEACTALPTTIEQPQTVAGPSPAATLIEAGPATVDLPQIRVEIEHEVTTHPDTAPSASAEHAEHDAAAASLSTPKRASVAAEMRLPIRASPETTPEGAGTVIETSPHEADTAAVPTAAEPQRASAEARNDAQEEACPEGATVRRSGRNTRSSRGRAAAAALVGRGDQPGPQSVAGHPDATHSSKRCAAESPEPAPNPSKKKRVTRNSRKAAGKAAAAATVTATAAAAAGASNEENMPGIDLKQVKFSGLLQERMAELEKEAVERVRLEGEIKSMKVSCERLLAMNSQQFQRQIEDLKAQLAACQQQAKQDKAALTKAETELASQQQKNDAGVSSYKRRMPDHASEVRLPACCQCLSICACVFTAVLQQADVLQATGKSDLVTEKGHYMLQTTSAQQHLQQILANQ
jgi:hypothetical protein